MIPSYGLPEPPLVAPPVHALTVANFNVLNLRLAGQVSYPNDTPPSAALFDKKTSWIGAQIDRLRADIIAFEEVWHVDALRACFAKSELGEAAWKTIAAPGADGHNATPKVALASRVPMEVESVASFPSGLSVEVPDLSALVGPMRGWERPIAHGVASLQAGLRVHVLAAHLKSKRPRFLESRDGTTPEDERDPLLQARAGLRSLIMRGAEAAGLRLLVLDLRRRFPSEPVILMGDLNDGPHAVTTQLAAATPGQDKSAYATGLWNAFEVQDKPLVAARKDVAFSHLFHGQAEVLDHIFVSEEFVVGAARQRGRVLHVDYYNDHLNDGRDESRSDHGMVRALLSYAAQT